MATGNGPLRRGFSLIEMLAALTVGSVLMGIAVSILAMLMRIERGGREQLHQDMVTARLARQFRDDVHAATRLAPAEAGGKGSWQLVLAPDHTVTYRALPEVVERDEAEAGKPARHESYTLPAGWSARLIAPAGAGPPLASLDVGVVPPSVDVGVAVVLPPRGDSTTVAPTVRIEALVGRDHRFTTSPQGSR